MADLDPYQWLEDITGERALSWVRERNAETVAELAGARFEALRAEIREVLDSADRIPYVTRRGRYRYNFWRDAEHPRGLWRRATLASYRGDAPDWEVLLDLDELARAEVENWVWDSARCLRPDYRLALISLSRGGSDATVVREFDIERREFVADGFALPEAKSAVDWIDADRVYVATDFGPGSLTTSGLPRTVREWRRGTPLSDAELVYEGKPDDTMVLAYHDDTEGYERDFVRRGIEFFRSEVYLRTAAGLRRIEVPTDAILSTHREWLLIELRTEWTVGGTAYPAGALLAGRLDAFLGPPEAPAEEATPAEATASPEQTTPAEGTAPPEVAGGEPVPPPDRRLTVLFEPDERTSLARHSWTRHHLILDLMQDVTSRLELLTPTESGRWHREPLTPPAGGPALRTASAWGTDAHTDDEYLLHTNGFLTPSTLDIGTVGAGPAVPLKREPSFFDAAGMSVRQDFATSDDGTPVPYFTVGTDDPDAPTLLYGYGGFEISLQPSYNGTIGRAWLARGGRYVVANLRGGGEYGARWHNAALKHDRHRVYEDFAAVATDLIHRGRTTPGRLGIRGGSNGGLLMGVMLTRYPDLFGAVAASVPLTDMLRFHQLLVGALWTAEYGDPDEAADRPHLLAYSPYHQLRAGRRYPPTLLTTSTKDDRVHPGHARKLVARMREYALPVHYYENIEGGHGAAANNDQAAFMSALAYEFLWTHLGGS